MAEKPLTDDELKQVRLLLNSFEFCEQCQTMVPNLVGSECYDDDGYHYCCVCPDCNESNTL